MLTNFLTGMMKSNCNLASTSGIKPPINYTAEWRMGIIQTFHNINAVWFHLSQDTDQWWVLEHTVMNLQVP